MSFDKARKRAKEIEANLIKRNGGFQDIREFTNKEVYLLLLDEMNKKLDTHIAWCQAMQEKYIPEFNKQVEVLAHVIDELPDKGFCEKTNRLLDECYPRNEESVPDKIKILWYDRKILKYILITSIGALITSIIMLGIGFIKGTF